MEMVGLRVGKEQNKLLEVSDCNGKIPALFTWEILRCTKPTKTMFRLLGNKRHKIKWTSEYYPHSSVVSSDDEEDSKKEEQQRMRKILQQQADNIMEMMEDLEKNWNLILSLSDKDRRESVKAMFMD